MVRIGVAGCGGRMGRMLIAEAHGTEGAEVVGGIDAKGSPAVGRDLGELAGVARLGIAAGDDAAKLFERADVVVDFTLPQVSAAHAELAAAAGKAMVIGTTGLDKAQTGQVRRAAERAAIVHAANMSVGVNLLLGLVEQV